MSSYIFYEFVRVEWVLLKKCAMIVLFETLKIMLGTPGYGISLGICATRIAFLCCIRVLSVLERDFLQCSSQLKFDSIVRFSYQCIKVS